MSTYKLIFTVAFKDTVAIKQVKGTFEALSGVVSGADRKLQQVYQDQHPRCFKTA